MVPMNMSRRERRQPGLFGRAKTTLDRAQAGIIEVVMKSHRRS